MSDKDTLKRAAELLRHMSDAGSTDEYRSCNDSANDLDALAAAPTPPAQEEYPCLGVPDPACHYLSACGRICNKCGRVHTPAPPAQEAKPVAKVVLTEQLGLPCLRWLDLDRQFDFKGGEMLYAEAPDAARRIAELEAERDRLRAEVKRQKTRRSQTNSNSRKYIRKLEAERNRMQEALELHLRHFESQHGLLLELGAPDFVQLRDVARAALGREE